ncbi:hypothetical protein BT69DRAFT_1293201 [Atractiella rhizophila]|nr:hypothetical protein BT69DRAFT_1293201 [Atractiella rhizophila]
MASNSHLILLTHPEPFYNKGTGTFTARVQDHTADESNAPSVIKGISILNPLIKQIIGSWSIGGGQSGFCLSDLEWGKVENFQIEEMVETTERSNDPGLLTLNRCVEECHYIGYDGEPVVRMFGPVSVVFLGDIGDKKILGSQAVAAPFTTTPSLCTAKGMMKIVGCVPTSSRA